MIQLHGNVHLKLRTIMTGDVMPNLLTISKKNSTKRKKTKQDNPPKNISSENNSLWIFKRKLNTNYTTIYPLTANNNTTYTDEDQAEILAISYAKQFSSHSNLASQDHLTQVSETVCRLLVTSLMTPSA